MRHSPGQEPGKSDDAFKMQSKSSAIGWRGFHCLRRTLPDSRNKVRPCPFAPYAFGGLEKAWKILSSQFRLFPAAEGFFEIPGPPGLGVARRPVIRSMRMR